MNTPQSDMCILFADVSGSTRLYEKLGDADALATIGRCIDRMTRAVLANRGRVVKTIGDEVMATFDSAESGMLAASDMQHRIDDLPLTGGVKLMIRVGFHYGPTIIENNDFFGDTVNVAARMAGLAKGGQIVTTGDCVAQLPELLRQSTRSLDALTVKGKALDIQVCEVIWQENAELTMMADSATAAPPREASVRLLHAGSETLLTATSPPLTLGRDAGCDIVVGDPSASRTHGRIERRRDKFVYVDVSSNGTYVTFQGEPEMALKREEIILRGSGRIVFGHPFRSAAEDHVDFVADA